ncbi:MBL fold metallo-hydrolase [Cytobacillus sp. FJAT-54145]|uniref:MBL fold metallo-hydrolase n=1 Tax=Cytobacillus spartinae TaxID=3299023 RepID=A0ABW6KJW4_9BACI
MKKPTKLAENLFLIDGFDLKLEERTGTYVLTEKDLTIIETSASPSIPYVLEGLDQLGYSPDDIKYIIVTHIHLDHAGGAGLLLEKCPNATVIVHPKGKRHLEDPSRLIAGARAVYGEKFDLLFDPILPIPEDRLLEKMDKEQLSIGDNCTLTFYDSPGHANHHFSIHHSSLNGIFTGDTAGISYPQLYRDGIELYLPSTSPNQFDPQKMLTSIELFKSLNPDLIFFGHYGMSANPQEVFKQVSAWLDEFLEAAKKGYEEGETIEQKVKKTNDLLVNRLTEYLSTKGVPKNHEVNTILALDMEVSSMGLIDYLYKLTKK